MTGLIFHGVAEKMTRRFAGIVIGSQAFALFFGSLVADGIARADRSSTHTTYLTGGLVLAGLCVLAAGSLRRPWGITLGWVLEVATLAAALVVPMMLIVGLVFGALWVTALVQGHKMDQLTRDFERDHP